MAPILISASICWNAGGIPWLGGKSAALQVQDKPAPTGSGEEVKVAERRDAPSIGKGKVKIIEFSDFQCSFCQRFFNDAYKEIKSKYADTGKVKFVFRHYPLPFHQNA